MTLAVLAKETGFTTGYLSQIENDLAMPALSALADIAAALGTDVSAFFPQQEAARVRVSRAGDSRRIRIAEDPTTEYVVLASRGSDGAFSGLIARFTKESDQLSSRHFGERFFYVRSGEGVLEIGGERHELRPGRFVHYSSHHEHTIRVTSEPLETVWLVDPPII
jgi:transcriptional regulator with XRE-family HTH domain